MNTNPILLQKKYARVIEQFANQEKIDLNEALDSSITPKRLSWCSKESPICIAEATHIWPKSFAGKGRQADAK